MSFSKLLLCGGLAICGTAVAGVGPAQSGAHYKISQTIPLGSPEQWDYLTYDSVSGRVFVAHGSGIDVLDGATGKLLGKVAVPGANGIAVIATIGKGYAGSRTKKAALIFDLKTLKVIKELPADEDTDAVVYDPASQRVFIMQGDPHNITVIDTRSDSVVTKLALDGQPEFAAVDGNGKLYVNIVDKNEIQKIDTKMATIEATWSISDCERPHGLAISPADHRLFATCVNSKLLVVDSVDGKIVAALPIGRGSDAAAYDAARTHVLARTMALDPMTGRVFLVAADRVEVDPTASDPRKRYAIRAGSAALLFADPSD